MICNDHNSLVSDSTERSLKTAERDSTTEQRLDLRHQLEHEIKSHLGVGTLGHRMLDGARDDPELFAKLHGVIEEGGIAPLKIDIVELVKIATTSNEG